MNQLNETLRNEAIDLGLCQQWQNDWRANKNTGQLIEMFKRGIDFCLEHRWPSCKWIVSNFDRMELRKHNVYIGEKYTPIVLVEGVAVIRESCAKIITARNSVVTIYCQDCPEIKIIPGRGARVFIHLYNSKCKGDLTVQHAVVKSYIHDENSTFDNN